MKRGYSIALVIVACMALVSLLLNAVILFGLLRARRIAMDAQVAAVEGIADVRQMLTSIGDDTFTYTFHIQEKIPVAASIPFEETLTVPINTTVPIDTVVIIPINAGPLGTFDVDVPIRTVIPIDLEVTVPISQTVDIATTVPLDFAVPVEIRLDETPLIGYLDELDQGLAQMEDRLTKLGEKLTRPWK
ncbi:MAG TPA: hypothetical protein ENF52_02920 [Chloroflexi bacterium]|nr:hypothetical protein [Chloroflexota bacterium]